jgi:hypothetical protein
MLFLLKLFMSCQFIFGRVRRITLQKNTNTKLNHACGISNITLFLGLAHFLGKRGWGRVYSLTLKQNALGIKLLTYIPISAKGRSFALRLRFVLLPLF